MDFRLSTSAEAFRREVRRFLPAIGRGEVEFCIGLTEPEHGSDLAGVECRAEATGNGFRLHGQKVYSSNAHHADYCQLLARTGPQVPGSCCQNPPKPPCSCGEPLFGQKEGSPQRWGSLRKL